MTGLLWLQGIYTDCSCGTARGETVTQAEIIGRQQAFDAALALAKSKGKWFSTWAGPSMTQPPTSAGNCVAAMENILRIGANASHSLQLAGGWGRAVTNFPI